MVASFVFKDGQSGATPASAANLNRLALVADLAIAGTPTGDGVRTALALFSGGDSGWVDCSSSISAATWTTTTWYGWTGAAYRVKNGGLYVRVAVAMASGAAPLTASADANIGDTALLGPGAVPSKYLNGTPMLFPVHRSGSSDGWARISLDGSVQLVTWSPTATISPGDQIIGSGYWLTD